jgi:hypothetical protein
MGYLERLIRERYEYQGYLVREDPAGPILRWLVNSQRSAQR